MFKKHHININTKSLPLAPYFSCYCAIEMRDRGEPRMMIKIRPSDKNDGQSFGSSTIGDGSEFSILLLSRIWHSTPSTFFVRVQAIAWCSSSSVIWRWLFSLFAQFYFFVLTVAASLNTFLSILHNFFFFSRISSQNKMYSSALKTNIMIWILHFTAAIFPLLNFFKFLPLVNLLWDYLT